MSVATSDLEQNNSVVYEYLDHLTSNSIFTSMLIANTAFINELFAQQITIQTGGYIQSQGYIEGSHGFRITPDGLIRAYEGRFAGGLGNEDTENISYRSWLPFINGFLVIIISSTMSISSSILESRKVIGCGFVSTHMITYFESGQNVSRTLQEYCPIYTASGLSIVADSEEEQGFLSKQIIDGFKIASLPSGFYENNLKLVFHYLNF
jgi:hypothetical protein